MTALVHNASFPGRAAVAEHDCLLYAHWLDDELIVYRSDLVRDSDAIYGPVADLTRGLELAHEDNVTDLGMVFGQATLRVYRVAVDPHGECAEVAA